MKIKSFIIVLVLLASFAGFAQEITGSWNGLLAVQGQKLRLVFNISKVENVLQANMDSPDQNAFGIPVSEVSFANNQLKVVVKQIGLEYNGTLQGDSIVGTFNQMGLKAPLVLTQTKIEVKAPERPQNPKAPFPYAAEEVTFANVEANIKLAGTLTLPDTKGKVPAVVLISGSGPQNRDEELMGHKPFHVLADHLTRNGFAVLRFDDRGVGQSEGNFAKATSFDFATDAKAAIDYLKTRSDIDASKIGLMGHSEGGLVAPIVASQHPADVGFIVLLAGPGLPGSQIILLQQELIGRASGASQTELELGRRANEQIFAQVYKSKDPEVLRTEITNVLKTFIDEKPEIVPQGLSPEQYMSMQISQLLSPWMLNFLTYDPVPALEKVRCPVLAINGEKDLQVPPKENLSKIAEALQKGGNKKVTTLELTGLNHLFQECETGAPSEYAQIEQTMSPKALDAITGWLKKEVK